MCGTMDYHDFVEEPVRIEGVSGHPILGVPDTPFRPKFPPRVGLET